MAVLAGVILTSLPGVALAADGQLATTKLQKAAVACQKVIAQVSAKVLTGKFKALDACANAALTCVQTKQDQGDSCFAKAGQACAKQLNKATVALTKAQAKIASAKSCATELRLPDLLSADGLGLGQVAGQCQADFGLDICTGLDPLAACLVRTHERAAGSLYGAARPRAGELLTTLPDVVLPPVDGLPVITGCAQCSVAVADRKAVEQCGRALTKTTQGLVTKLDGEFGACAQKVFACVQTKADASACLTKARGGCDKGADKIAKVVGKFATAIAKKCGALNFDQLASTSGLNLDALGDSCVVLGVSAPTSAGTFAGCMQQRAQCSVAELVQQAVSRVGEFGDGGKLGNLGSDLTTSCPVANPMLSVRSGGRAHAGIFGSITKIIKSIRRPRAPGVAGLTKPGGRPIPAIGGRPRPTIFGGSTRIPFGAVTKIPFRYRTGGRRSQSSQARLAEDPSTLIVTVQREDMTLDDHFEIALNPAPEVETEVEDEVEVEYQGTLPSCAFTLELAIRDDGVVSDYTPLLQVVDAALTPTPTPKASPAGGTITEIIDASGDGAGNTLDTPEGVAVDRAGNVYVNAYGTNNAFKIAPGGTITEIIDASGDGAGNTLSLSFGIAVDGAGNVYVTGGLSDNAFKITPGGTITEIIDASGDGAGNALDVSRGIAVDGVGNVYVTGAGSDNAFKITPGGTITEIIDASGDRAGNTLSVSYGIAVDGAGNVYVAGAETNNAFKIIPGG